MTGPSEQAWVAVAGGRGFIGRRIVAALEAQGRPALGFGREGPPARTGPCAALVWAAGARGGDAAAMTDEHVAAPLRAVQALRPRHVVYLSSAEVYGRIPAPFHETDEPKPETVYGHAKLAGEFTLAAVCAALGATLLVLRPTVVYGPGQAPGMLLPAALAALRAGQPFPASEGQQTRDFLHVDDLAALVLRGLADDAEPGTYNAGGGHELPVREALLQLAAAVGPEAAALLRFGAVPTRPGEALRYAVDLTRSEQRLGWRPTIALADGLRGLVDAPHQ